MTSKALEVISRGLDSSGRVVRGTRQSFQFYDRINEDVAGGIFVIVQGGFMGSAGASASAGAHRLAMCDDYRSWNLSGALRTKIVHYGRDLGGTMWWRTEADGFDEHIHNNLIGDSPADQLAINQVVSYRAGRNGLKNNNLDRDPYRPKRIGNYIYLPEDDMFEPADRLLLKKVLANQEAEKTQDQKDRDRDKRRFESLVTKRGLAVDRLTLLINKTTGEVKRELQEAKADLMTELKNDPDIDGKDNPSDDAMAAANAG